MGEKRIDVYTPKIPLFEFKKLAIRLNKNRGHWDFGILSNVKYQNKVKYHNKVKFFVCPKCERFYEEVRVSKKICFNCYHSDWQKKDYAKNPEKYRKSRRLNRKIAEYQKKYREKNRDKLNAYGRCYMKKKAIKRVNRMWAEEKCVTVGKKQ